MELDKPINWPENARCAVAFTFDPDVEALWFFDPKNRNKPKTLSLGTYGIKRGLPRILDLMEQYEIPSTFFTLGWFAEEYPEVMKEIHRKGHEIAAHGYLHENLGDLDKDEVQEVIQKTKKAIHDVIGKYPVGMRAHGDYQYWVFKILKEEGFTYDSSMKDDDRPYKMMIDGKLSNFIQIPFHWVNDDFPFFGFEKNQRPIGTSRILSPYQALETWKIEFDGYYKWGLCFCIALHPQVCATPRARRGAVGEPRV